MFIKTMEENANKMLVIACFGEMHILLEDLLQYHLLSLL